MRRLVKPRAIPHWSELIVKPSRDKLTRGYMPCWQWRIFHFSPALLIPRTETSLPVAFEPFEDTRLSDYAVTEVQWESVPETRGRIVWAGGEEIRTIPNGMILCCASDEVFKPDFLSRSIPERFWNYRNEAPRESRAPAPLPVVEHPPETLGDRRLKRKQLAWDF
jgi:hypothetical protein